MKINDILWQYVCNTLTKIKKLSDELHAATHGLMIAPESPLLNSSHALEDLTVKTLSVLIGDHFDYLAWYVAECGFGSSPMTVTHDGVETLVKDFDTLRSVIEQSNG